MKRHTLIYLYLNLLLFSLFMTSCIEQTKTSPAINSGVTEQAPAGHKARLIKTQGSNEHQNIHCSLQDKNGNLWFGTTGEGVYRFDEKEFTQFTEQDGLSNNTVWCMLEDDEGNIWFGTDDLE